MKAIVTILLTIAGFAILGGLARPLWDDISELRGQLVEVNSTLSGLNDTLKKQENLIASYNSISEEERDRLLNQHLPKKPDAGTLLIAMEEIASRNNVLINSVSFKEQTAARPTSALARTPASKIAAKLSQEPIAEELAFTATISTSYEDLKAFLKALESHIRLIDVTAIAFSSSEKSKLNVSLTAKVYYRK